MRDLLTEVADVIPGMSVNALVVSLLEASEPRMRELLLIAGKLKTAPNAAALLERVEALVADEQRDKAAWREATQLMDEAVEQQKVEAGT